MINTIKMINDYMCKHPGISLCTMRYPKDDIGEIKLEDGSRCLPNL